MITTKGKVKVGTAPFREAITAVYPHHHRTKTGDASAEHRVRIVLAAGWVYVMASNGSSTALAKVAVLEDSRSKLGERLTKLDPDDAPITIDLQPRQALEIPRMFASKAKAADISQELHITFDQGDRNDNDNQPWIRFTDAGGMLSDGESWELPWDEPHESFPDIIAATAKVLEQVGESSQSKPMAADGKILALYRKAADTFKAPVFVDGSGSPESRAFLVTVGPSFLGTLSSRHDDDPMGKRSAARLAWLEQISSRKLKSA